MYADNPTRDLAGPSFTDYMTIDFCYQYCRNLVYSFFGVQAGYFSNLNFSSMFNIYIICHLRTNCFCGNSMGKYGTATVSPSVCNGNSSQICGSGWANSVYKILCKSYKISYSIKLISQTFKRHFTANK